MFSGSSVYVTEITEQLIAIYPTKRLLNHFIVINVSCRRLYDINFA